jgi:membrane-associated PAP2 superfamily phosphatase/protein-S-isoprenylcysteine O-methyltransferase Ste14
MLRSADMNYRNTFFYALTQVVGVTALLGWLAYTVQYSGLDVSIARHFYDAGSRSFLWQNGFVPQTLGHIFVWGLLLASVVFTGAAALLSFRVASLQPARAVFWSALVVFCLIPLLVSALHDYTALPRPLALTLFGGYVRIPDGFWVSSGVPAGGALPSNYAAVGYSLFTLYFAGWALNRPRLRWCGLALGLAAGVLLSALQMAQGAHFFSQTLWSAALVWLVCSMVFYPLIVTRHRRNPSAYADYTVDDIWTHLSLVQVRRRRTLTVYGVLLVCLLPFLASTWGAGSWVHQTVEWLGLALIFMAMLGRCWCILYLGGHKGSDLIRQGPYSISRNPLYLFSMLAVTGIGAQSGSIVFGPILALFVYAVFNNVIDEEERLLRKVFGPQFDEYCAKVPRFGPRLAHWQADDELAISVSGLWNTVRDALPYFLALPLFELIELCQTSGWLPVLIRLP